MEGYEKKRATEAHTKTRVNNLKWHIDDLQARQDRTGVDLSRLIETHRNKLKTLQRALKLI